MEEKKAKEIKESRIYNKKAIRNILILILCGIITGFVLSGFFIDEANNIVQNINPGHNPSNFPDVDYIPEPLAIDDIIFPSIGVVIVCISTFLLIGLIISNVYIYLKTKSKYILGLLFFFSPLLLQSIFSINTLRSLYVTPAIPFIDIQNRIGFNPSGLGGIILILTIFEIIGLSIVLYLSSE